MPILVEATPPGSNLYYSLLYCDEKIRQRITALRTFYQILRNIPFTCQNTALAQIKFQWWREECDRLTQKTAQHPVTQCLQACTFQHENLSLILEAFAKDSTVSLYESETALEDFYRHTAGLLEKTVGKIYGITDPSLADRLENLGIFIQRIANLNALRMFIIQGKIYFSGETLLTHHVTLYQLSQLKLTSHIHNLLIEEAQKIRAYYQIDLPFSPTLILANIHHALLREIERLDVDLLTHMISLTPLRKWWIAWRTKRKNGKFYKSAG